MAIEVKYVSVAHPRANDQIERANGMILDGLKKQLYDENNKKGGNGYTSCRMLSGGSGPSRPKPQVKLLSFFSTVQKQFCQQI